MAKSAKSAKSVVLAKPAALEKSAVWLNIDICDPHPVSGFFQLYLPLQMMTPESCALKRKQAARCNA